MSDIIFFDTETTGLPDWKSPSESDIQPHLVQLAAIQVDSKTRQVKQSMDVIIKPNGWEIPKEVSEIHGITTEQALDVGIDEKLAVEMLLALWGKRLRVAHNTTFDNRIIRIATKRYFDEQMIDLWHQSEYACTGLLSKPIMKVEPKNRYGYKMPKLSEAYQHFTGKELENAHTALADATACMEIYWGIQEIKKAA